MCWSCLFITPPSKGKASLLNWIMNFHNFFDNFYQTWQNYSINFHGISWKFMNICGINSDRISCLLMVLNNFGGTSCQIPWYALLRGHVWTFTDCHKIPSYWTMNNTSKTMKHWWKFAKFKPLGIFFQFEKKTMQKPNKADSGLKLFTPLWGHYSHV